MANMEPGKEIEDVLREIRRTVDDVLLHIETIRADRQSHKTSEARSQSQEEMNEETVGRKFPFCHTTNSLWVL